MCEEKIYYKSQNLQERAQNKQTHSKASQQSLMAGTKNQHQVVYTKSEYQTTTELKLYRSSAKGIRENLMINLTNQKQANVTRSYSSHLSFVILFWEIGEEVNTIIILWFVLHRQLQRSLASFSLYICFFNFRPNSCTTLQVLGFAKVHISWLGYSPMFGHV